MSKDSPRPLRLKCLGCEALARIAYLCAAHSPHLVDLTLYEIGLHNQPGDLRATLQAAIDGADPERYDAVVLIYGLCGQATLGLQAGRVPLVIPKAHDCITLFLGDRRRYKIAFEEEPGTYWYTNDYMERKANSGVSLGTGLEIDLAAVYDEYVEKYGQENADYLMEVMGTWRQHYKRAVFIDNGIGDGRATAGQAESQAEQRGWRFEQLTGDLVLIRRLLAGDWGENFLVLTPGQQSIMTYDDEIIGCHLLQEQTVQ
ncbi:MAG: DUF1638 domain-containing protein [Caldilineaceae bacterium]|nr:DUF1638 domain-containing protein [Caldilineaceae bacterium]HRJ41431.1 DUF1638 domain-containing protein [Caldilineaceae bacterium]